MRPWRTTIVANRGASRTHPTVTPGHSTVTRLLVLTLAIAAAATAEAQPGFTPAPSFSPPSPAVVRIVVPEGDGTAFGSGSLVAVNESSGLVLTNWHVVRDAAGPITVLFPDGFRSGAYLLRTDRDWDLAALAIRRPNVAPIALSSEVPRPGEELMIAGYGSGSYRSVRGRLTQYVSPGGNQPFEMIEMAAPARNGDSGGPILNNRGELAGVLFGSAFGRTTGSYCGRVRWFLGTVEGDFQRISAQALLAQQSQANPPLLAAIPAATPIVTTAARAPNSAPDVSRGSASLAPVPTLPSLAGPAQVSSAPMASIPTRPAGGLPSGDEVKTVLAAVGVITVLYHAMRLLGRAVG